MIAERGVETRPQNERMRISMHGIGCSQYPYSRYVPRRDSFPDSGSRIIGNSLVCSTVQSATRQRIRKLAFLDSFPGSQRHTSSGKPRRERTIRSGKFLPWNSIGGVSMYVCASSWKARLIRLDEPGALAERCMPPVTSPTHDKGTLFRLDSAVSNDSPRIDTQSERKFPHLPKQMLLGPPRNRIIAEGG